MTKNKTKSKQRFVGTKELTACIAKWAIRQSPYECPHNLVAAIRALHKRADGMLSDGHKDKFERWGFTKLSESKIAAIVKTLVLETPELQCWNRCRKGRTPEIIATSIHWKKPDPDRDFIDLDAVVMNVMRELRSEWHAEDSAFYATDGFATTTAPK